MNIHDEKACVVDGGHAYWGIGGYQGIRPICRKKGLITYKKLVCYIPQAAGYQLVNQITGLPLEK